MKGKSRAARTLSGFTLIEILIALAVFAILATITSSAMYYAFNTRSRVTLQAERLVTLQLAITLIERDTEQTVNRAIRGDGMQLFPAFIGEPNYMELTRSGLTNPNSREKRSTMKRIALFCKNNQLIRRSWNRLDLTKRSDYEERVLLKGVTNCKFAYLSEKLQFLSVWGINNIPKKSSDSKNDKTEKSSNIPKAVQLSLNLSN